MRKIAPVLLVFLLSSLLIPLAFGQETEQSSSRAFGFWDVWALPRVWVGALLGLIGLILLMSNKLSSWIRALSLVIIFFAFAIFSNLPLGDVTAGMGLHPSPMCSIEKPFLFIQMGHAVPIVFTAILAFVAVMTVVGNKLFCGWNCPIGAIQELLHRVPLPKKLKIKLPFKVTNSIRMVFFLLFLAILFASGFSLYAYINPFEFLHWSLEWTVIPAFVVTFIAALFIFRPFCYLICPLGLATWMLEHISIIRVKVDQKACTKCMRCVQASPCPTIPAILDGKKSRPDCHACGICIKACPENALKFKL
jgi:polyferredoxin